MTRRSFGCFVLAVSLLLGLWACAGANDASGASISGDELASEIEAGKAPLVLDVRSEAEYRAGHIPGAILIPHDQLASRVGELAGHENDEIVVHCKSGRRAAMAEQVLRDDGFTHVVDLQGHMDGWKAAGHPVEQGE